jgi:hypothetical protein
MAILEGLPSVKVSILCDGRPLHEYVDPDLEDQRNTVTRYIEAKDDVEFAIEYSVGPETKKIGEGIAFSPNVDGNPVSGIAVRKYEFENGTWTKIQSHIILSETQRTSLKFSSLETSDLPKRLASFFD